MTIGDRRRAVAAVALVITLALSRDGWAGPPTDQLHTKIDRIYEALQDLRGSSKEKSSRTIV